MEVPTFLPYYVIIGSLAIIGALVFAMHRSLGIAGWSRPEHDHALRLGVMVLGGWFVLAVVLAAAGLYRGEPERMPRIEFGLVIPIVVALLIFWRSAGLRRLIDAVPQHWLVGVQTYRALGAVFLILLGMDRLPGAFAWPAGLGDVLVGAFAPIVAIAYLRNPRRNARWVWAWNVLGLLDLVIAVGTGVLTSPSPIQKLALHAPNELIANFPLALVPTFLVPISVVLHFASLRRLMRD